MKNVKFYFQKFRLVRFDNANVEDNEVWLMDGIVEYKLDLNEGEEFNDAIGEGLWDWIKENESGCDSRLDEVIGELKFEELEDGELSLLEEMYDSEGMLEATPEAVDARLYFMGWDYRLELIENRKLVKRWKELKGKDKERGVVMVQIVASNEVLTDIFNETMKKIIERDRRK